MGLPRALPTAVTDTVAAVRCLNRRGVVDLADPCHAIRMMRRTRTIGPPAAVILDGAERFPYSPAVTDDRGTASYQDVDRRSEAIAGALSAAGLVQGSVLAVLARDHRNLIGTLSAAGRIGVCVVMMNTGMAAHQLVEVALREKVDGIVYDEEFVDRVDHLPADLPRFVSWTDSGSAPGVVLDDLPDVTAPVDRPTPDAWAGLTILTSGTTGLPKGARRRSVSPFTSALLIDRVPVRPRDTVLVASPLFHATGFGFWGVSAALGCNTVLLRRFDPERTLAAIADNRVAILIAVPTMMSRILALDATVRARHDTSSLRAIILAGSAVTPALSEAIQDTFGDVLHNLYGSTEVAVAAVAQPHELRRAPGTVGRPPVSSHLRLYDDEGRRVRDGSPGELYVKNGSPFEGYSDGRTRKIVDGYMATGDIGRFRPDGLLMIEGRADDMIVSGGENVHPVEVENVLADHETVRDVAVIGVDDEDFGQRLCAFVVPEEDGDAEPEVLRAHVRDRLARHCVPREIVLIDELPRNATGKVLRAHLRERFETGR